MENKELQIEETGFFRKQGWRKNLLSVAAGFLLSLFLFVISYLFSDIRVLSEFNLAAAIVPFIGFSLGIPGSIGFFLGFLLYILFSIKTSEGLGAEFFLDMYYIRTVIGLCLYCVLPSLLWYHLPLKGEKKTPYPRMDTSAHVIKYYVIMLVSVAVYVIVSFFGYDSGYIKYSFMNCIFVYTQYLVVALILGIPMIILVSLIRYRTLTINERMVLAFLVVGVTASALCAFVLYKNTLYLDPSLFEDYEALASGLSTGRAEMLAVLERYDKYWNWYFMILAIMLNVLLLVEMFFMRRVEKKVTRPILHLADVLEPYTTLKDGSLDPKHVAEQCLPYRQGYGEVSSLTSTCVSMVEEIDRYTENLQQVTAEKERIGTELDVASRIQRDMLPGIFPPFPGRKDLDIYASMTPAREVGGDFYDFYFIDQNHLALTIADVSGKGVPASLFMVISKTLLHTHAYTDSSPREILTNVNHLLCENNHSFMFCTVWFGILDMTNGRLIAANAGHEYPAFKRNGGEYELLKGEHDPALGFRDGLQYHEYELALSPGDCLFLYTDGVTEATAATEEMFGEERLEQTLNKDPDCTPEKVIGIVYSSIEDFVKDAPQFDDITMLCVRYLGSGNEDVM